MLFSGLAAAQAPPTFRSEVALVRVDAEVTDGTRNLTGLAKEDFRILDKGQARPVLYSSEDQEPLDLILLFDISGSMRPNVEKVAASARAGMAELHPGDRIAVMVFNRKSRLVAPFTGDLSAVERTIREDVLGLRFGGGTRILAAVDDAALRFLREPRTERRRAVLVVTDNIGQPARRESTVVRHLWEADTLVSGLIVRAALMRALSFISVNQGINGVAEKTGGDVVKGDPGESFREMMRRIRRRYSLYYAPPPGKPGEARQVQVQLSPEAQGRTPRARVRARKGYLVPAPAADVPVPPGP